MCYNHAVKDFAWLSVEERQDLFNELVQSRGEAPDPEGDIGMFLEVSVDYPSELHDKHDSLPFLPGKFTIDSKDLPPHMRDLFSLNKKKEDFVEEKLCSTLKDKPSFIGSLGMIAQALRHGLKLKEVRRGIKFKQEPYLKDFLLELSRLRAEADNDFSKKMFKMISVSIFGRSIANVGKYSNGKLVNRLSQFRKAISSPFLREAVILNKNLAIVFSDPPKPRYDNPVFLGANVLAKSKELFYDWVYHDLALGFGDDFRLIYYDTVSQKCVLFDVFSRLLKFFEFSGLFSFSKKFARF